VERSPGERNRRGDDRHRSRISLETSGSPVSIRPDRRCRAEGAAGARALSGARRRASLAGETAIAQRAFEEAQWRDPRSLPAAYFLADRYFRSGDVRHGLHEVAALARLSPDGGAAAVPYLTQYAANAANWPALRELFASNPQFARPVLAALAANIGTVPAALALSSARETGTRNGSR
jgi:hypothetical protein